MNHIKRLTKDVAALKNSLQAYDAGVDDIVRYLTSQKFHEDTTVQVQDVLNRITTARMAVVDALDELSEQARCPDA